MECWLFLLLLGRLIQTQLKWVLPTLRTGVCSAVGSVLLSGASQLHQALPKPTGCVYDHDSFLVCDTVLLGAGTSSW